MTFKKAIRTLELNKILDKLKYFASANITKDYIDEIEISTDYEEINKRLILDFSKINLFYLFIFFFLVTLKLISYINLSSSIDILLVPPSNSIKFFAIYNPSPLPSE